MQQPDVYTRADEDPVEQTAPKLEPIDPRKLKLKELSAVEQMVGRRIAGELQSGDLGMDTMRALLTVVQQRHDPGYTFEVAGEVELGELEALFEDEDSQPPDLPPGVPDPTPAIRSGGDISDGWPGAAH